jgi:prepilin-type N-terminal cleavage/methylation domain-containing protein/prepilin-type processing-associated H-X9-DG protein
MPRHTNRHRGFTLVELLVVLAIIGMLLALLLPAVQMAREAANRAACTANLRQIGCALHGYLNAWTYFPPGGIELRIPPSDTTKKQLAWSLYLLPYLEQQGLYNTIDLNQAFDSGRNAAAAAAVLPVYVCPSAPRQSYLLQGRGVIDYGGIHGERITSANQPPKGIMLYDQPVSPPMIRDGLSNTLIVGECAGFADGQWINGRNLFDQSPFPMNHAPSFEQDLRSDHPGGANGLFADGSARLLSETMALTPLAAICTRAGGEPNLDFQ